MNARRSSPYRRALLLIALAAGAAIGCSASSDKTASVSQALTGGGLSGTLAFSSDWGSGYCANVTLTNASTSTATSWQVVVGLNQATLSSSWSATFTSAGAQLTVTPLSWNATLSPGSSTSFGFCANATGSNYHPTLTTIAAIGTGAIGTPDAGATAVDSGAKDSGAVDSGAKDSGTATVGDAGALACTIPGSPAPGSGSLTWYFFGQGTAEPSTGQFQTACGYLGTESSGEDSDAVTNIANAGFFAAIPGTSSTNFNTNNDCGACVKISNGSKSVVATIIDECPIGGNPVCAAAGHLDISRPAFNALGFANGDPSGVTWSFVPCPVTGDVVVRVKPGNPNQVYIENEVLPISTVTVNGAQATRLFYGAWQLPGNAAGATLTLTDVDGRVVTVTVPGGAPAGQNNDTGKQFPACL